MRLGWPEALIILAIVLIVFGVGRLPQVGSAIGKGIRSFRKAQAGEDEEETKPSAEATKKEAKS
jgi:sec-independent protein translocase protein TatA